ncbi:MAG: hypothetical protein V4754_11355 [Pseudomonadota bacterium]
MQINQVNIPTGLASGGAGAADAVEPALKADAASAAPASDSTIQAAPAPLRRGLSSWDHQLQGDIASAQQALDFLEQSASQLQALKSELAAKLASHQGREGQVEARVRQFSQTWRQRAATSGGSLDAQLSYSNPANQRFSIRGLNLANLQAGGKEVLAFSVGGASQTLRSVSIEPGMAAGEIVQRFDQALAPANIRVGLNQNGTLIFSTPETSWAAVRDTLAVRGSGIRFPTGQMNRVKTDEEPALITPDGWSTADSEALRQTLQQVVQALAQVQQARDNVSRALAGAASRADSAQPVDIGVGMETLAQNFISKTNEPSYDSLLSVSSALVGISRERVLSLLALR